MWHYMLYTPVIGSLLFTIVAGMEPGKGWSQETLKAPPKNNPEMSMCEPYRPYRLLSNQIPADVPKLASLSPLASDFQLKKPTLQWLLDHVFSIHTSPHRVMTLMAQPRSSMAKPSPVTSLLGRKLSLAGWQYPFHRSGWESVNQKQKASTL